MTADADLIARLRASADEVESFPHPSCCEHLHVAHKVMREAADELERLDRGCAMNDESTMLSSPSFDAETRLTYARGAIQFRNRVIANLRTRITDLEHRSQQDVVDAGKYRALHTPEIVHFLKAVENEALFQREKWGADHDEGKADTDWFWLLGYLAGKAIRPDATPEKVLHHIITTAAACLNWHAAKVGAYGAMRPGIAEPASAALLEQAETAAQGAGS